MGFFNKLLGGKSAESAYQPMPYATKERIKAILQIRQLEPMPAQAARAFQLASDPLATAADFVSVIEGDEVLSARVIRVANSVYFFRGTPANDIEKAVANIGLNELRCLISATMLRSLLQGKAQAREQAWANSVGTAIACKILSRRTDVNYGSAFLCGLLHDVGKLIMIRRNPEMYQNVISQVGAEQKESIEIEERLFELNHTEVGRWVGETWTFPQAAVIAIQRHHEPWPKDPSRRGRATTAALLVKCGDTLSHACGIGHPPSYRSYQREKEKELPQVWQQIGIGPDETSAIIEEFKAQFEKEFALYQSDK
jgi:HD-like signal output (HDOD) protein